MADLGWESDDPAFRHRFTSHLVPGATAEGMSDIDETQLAAVPKDNLRAFLDFDACPDGSDDIASVACPVLLVHARDDRMVPLADGQYLSDRPRSFRVLVVESENHVPVPGTDDFVATVLPIGAFLRQAAPSGIRGGIS